MQIYIDRHNNCLLGRYKISLESPYAVYFRESLIKLFYRLRNRSKDCETKASEMLQAESLLKPCQ